MRPDGRAHGWSPTASINSFSSTLSPGQGWGVFGNISLADQVTNPVHWFLNLGAGGVSPLPGRTADSWGVGYYYLATSNVVRENLRSVSPIGNEQGFGTLLRRNNH